MLFETNFNEMIENASQMAAAPQQEPDRQAYFVSRCREIVAAKALEKGRALTCHSTCIGCQMNAKDSEKLLGILKEIGYEETEREEDADFVIYNTCTVRENANQKVYGRLGVLSSHKKKHPDMLIAMCGCMMQEPKVVETIERKYRFVDIVFGTHNIYKLAELVYERLIAAEPDTMIVDVWKESREIVERLPSKRKYAFKAGVNIMFGCNNFCSYCIVPYVRGRERSRKPEEILEEVRALAAEGVIEIMLLGQNVNSYGQTLEQPVSFAELLRMVCRIDGIERVRFMTSHPKDLSDELIEAMAEEPKICRHLHLPLQSGSTRILKKMNRCYTKEEYVALAKKIRERIPDITLTTDIIVGFPGETEEDFAETMDVVRQVCYDSAFTFIYSKRTGTPAAQFTEQVPAEVIKPRFDALLKEVQSIAAKRCGADCGRVMDVLVEETDSHEEGYVTGRLSNNMTVHFAGEPALIGSIVKVRLDRAKGFYYIGSMVSDGQA